MSTINFIKLVCVCLLQVAISSCGENKSKTFVLKDIEFTFEGPLFEGSNPSQYTVSVDLAKVLKEEYSEGMSLEKVLLKKAEIHANDTLGFQHVNAFVLSAAGDNPELKMQELAVLNPLPANARSVQLIPSTEAEATNFFAEKQFYLVLDASLAKDREENIKLLGNFEFELHY
jgi:hypothetical protein